jgi:GAF domain-containing protein
MAALLCMRSGPNPFAVWEIELLFTIANHIAAALQFKKRDETADDGPSSPPNAWDLAHTWSVETKAPPGSLQAMLNNALDSALKLVEGDSGSILLCEESGTRIAACRGIWGVVMHGHEPAHGGPVSERVLAGRKPVIFHGQIEKKEVPKAAHRPEIVSSMVVPLKGRRKIIGLLNINRTTQGHLFEERELTLSSTMGHHIATAVENAKLHDAARVQTRYLGNLYKIARTITSTLQLDTVLKMIIERLRSLIGSDVSAILLYDHEAGRIQLASGHGIPDGSEQDYINLVLPAVRLTSSPRRPLVIPDLSLHPAYANSSSARDLGLRSAIIVPLMIKRKVVGMVAAYQRKFAGFPRPTLRLLLGLAELAAIAIENARLYERQSGIANITQRELLPGRLETPPGFEMGCKYAPAHQVGGDYYDLIRLDQHRFGILVADVSGKNVSAAIHVAMCKHSVRAIADLIGSPSALLQKMNSLIYDQTEPEAFVSMFYGVLDTKQKTMVYSSAGHDPGLLLRAKTDLLEYVETPGIVLGLVPHATFIEHETYFKLGDVLLLYTDGLVDALSVRHEGGLEILEETLRKGRLQPAQELADNIHRLAVASHTGKSSDDIALVALKKT